MRNKLFFCFLLLTSFAAFAETQPQFTITSTSFKDNQSISALHGCDGKNLSPELKWINPPAKTAEYALILTSPDWSAGFVYLWVVYNIPKTVYEFAEGANKVMPPEILQGSNFYHESNYRGPCPPDKRLHHYVFTIYALDAPLDLVEDEEPKDVMKAIKSHCIGEAHITGVYVHP